MKLFIRNWVASFIWTVLSVSAGAAEQPRPKASRTENASLPNTASLAAQNDLPQLTTRQWDEFLLGRIEEAKATRERLWTRDFTSKSSYERSIVPNRERFRRYIGAIDQRVSAVRVEIVKTIEQSNAAKVPSTSWSATMVRWTVMEGVNGEGVLLRPDGEIKACIVLLPDVDQTPEAFAGLDSRSPTGSPVAQRLVENGALVLIPYLVDRATNLSADERMNVFTNITHREWIYRQAAEVGRHIIGYEVQKVLAAVDWFEQSPLLKAAPGGVRPPVAVIGYGEGALLAFYAAALDSRISAAWISGYFQARERLWNEPLDRNVWGLLQEFGDAEIAALIAPRALLVEQSLAPVVNDLPQVASMTESRRSDGIHLTSAAPGTLSTPLRAVVQSEWQRALRLAGPEFTSQFRLVQGPGESDLTFGSDEAFKTFLGFLGLQVRPEPAQRRTFDEFTLIDRADRQRRTVRELQEHVQAQARLSEYERERFFWSKLQPTSATQWAEEVKPYREYFTREFIGQLPAITTPLRPRSRRLSEYSDARFTTFEVMIDVYPGVSAWGWLLLPTDVAPGERRPVVVCQHGAGGVPENTVTEQRDKPAFRTYQGFAAQLAARGFIVFAPFNVNSLTGESFRQLQRKANPLRASVFSIITASHRRLIDWLKQQPFVDPNRIGFYGISYGGKTALRVPAALEDYCLSICSGDFNDYVSKMTSVRYDKHGFLFLFPYETVEFNLANTFNHAEMAALIAPRPFMVEHGYKDRIAPVEWAAAEYAKVARLYLRLGIPDRTAMEYFDGPHTIHGQGTFDFLHQHLNWKKR